MNNKEEQYEKLTMAGSDLEYSMIKNYLEANGIPVFAKEKGFGGPIRSIYFGTNAPAFIDVYVDAENLEDARELIATDYSQLVEDDNESL